jgi:hypothetical protein
VRPPVSEAAEQRLDCSPNSRAADLPQSHARSLTDPALAILQMGSPRRRSGILAVALRVQRADLLDMREHLRINHYLRLAFSPALQQRSRRNPIEAGR